MSPLKLKILVVDREESDFLHSAVSVFDEAGFNVDSCSDWDSMQRKLLLSVRKTDFLIIDLSCFQERDSYLLLTELRGKEYTRDLKFILTTDLIVDELLLKTRQELGIVSTFNKSRHVEELLYILTDILPPNGENLRRSRRIPARFPVHVKSLGKTKVLCARNLSREGIFVENFSPEPVGTQAELSFTLPGKTTKLTVKAHVARATTGSHRTKQEVFPAGNGFEFREMSEESISLLKEYVEHEELRIFGPEELLSSEGFKEARDICDLSGMNPSQFGGR
ncbi:MAG: PilZ domain-containing protein [Terriglobia bacterium]